jgi:hypothetical protein
MTKFIPYPYLNPNKQLKLYCLLHNYENIYNDLKVEAITIYGDEFIESDDWANSQLGLDMGVIAIQIYNLIQVIGYYSKLN